jgi:hypothetical protein
VKGPWKRGNGPAGSIRGEEFLDLAEWTVSFSRKTLLSGFS